MRLAMTIVVACGCGPVAVTPAKNDALDALAVRVEQLESQLTKQAATIKRLAEKPEPAPGIELPLTAFDFQPAAARIVGGLTDFEQSELLKCLIKLRDGVRNSPAEREYVVEVTGGTLLPLLGPDPNAMPPNENAELMSLLAELMAKAAP